MSRYDWPGAPARETQGEGDDPMGRAGYNARRRTGLDLIAALQASRTPQRPERRPGRAPAPRAPASGRTHLWQPLGPAALLSGQAEGTPRVSGRINALAVHEDGQRVYAASANGGVWYSKDGGANWVSVAGLAATNTAGIVRPAQRNACNALYVEFGASEGEDLVFAGTGEVHGEPEGHAPDPEGGVGILVADKPLKSAEPDPWKREANNLTNHGIYAIAREPGGSTMLAATRKGLFQRPAPPTEGKDWTHPDAKPFKTLEDHCTDLLWTPAHAGAPARCWVWVEGGASMGLWVRDAGADEFKPVETAPGSYGYSGGRASLAASKPPTQVWAFEDCGDGVPPSLFRVTNPAGPDRPKAHGVDGVPNVLRDQGGYDIAIAVHPASPDRVAVAGSWLDEIGLDGRQAQYNASIVVADVAPDPANGGKLAYGLPASPYTMIGIGVHPDVHALAWSNNGATLWTGCDGGVFRSDRPTRPAGFYPRNHGLSISESNFLATHPRCEGRMVAGLQDNGRVERISSGVWKLKFKGDGGGVLMDAANPSRWMAQYITGTWVVVPSAGTGPLVRGGTFTEEKAAFYSGAACIGHTRPSPPAPAAAFSQTLIGTHRPWYSDDFGATWVTLPSATDPLGTPPVPLQDTLNQNIVACRWQDPEVAWVLCAQRLTRFTRAAGSIDAGGKGTWTPFDVMPAPFSPTGKAKKRDPAPPSLLDAAQWTDIAPNPLPSPVAGERDIGAIYVGTIGHPDKPGVDTLWWYDGGAAWHATGLRSKAVPAPVTAIAVDPAARDEVWVGTTVGVWRGKRTQAAGQPPEWAWTQFVNGLPEATVEDLAFFRDGTLVLLRAAIAARGIWELRLDTPEVQELSYLRAHDDDLRHRPATQLQRDNATARSWHGSPDVRPRTAPAAVASPSTLPWRRSTFPGATEALRRFQAALKSSTGDVRISANGIWDVYFSELLRDHGAPTLAVPAVLPPDPNPMPALTVARIDKPFWDLHMKPPHATAEPWGAAVPTEADLHELVKGLSEGDAAGASCELPPKPSKVEIVVHHRGLELRDGADVRVTLLKWIDPKKPKAAKFDNAATWLTGPVPVAAVNEVLNSAAGTTAQAMPAGWSFVGSTDATRRRTLAGQTLDPMRAGVASFDLNLTGLKNNTLVLLVAVIRAGADIALAADTPQNLAVQRPEVAVRSVRIVA